MSGETYQAQHLGERTGDICGSDDGGDSSGRGNRSCRRTGLQGSRHRPGKLITLGCHEDEISGEMVHPIPLMPRGREEDAVIR